LPSRSTIFLAIIAALTALSIWTLFAKETAYGLDVRGGIRLIYQIDPRSMPDDASPERVQNDLVRIMEGRVSAALGVVEGAVSKKGTDQIIVEIPGYTDRQEAERTLSTTARIIVYHAKNVSTPVRERRFQAQSGQEDIGGVPAITFIRSARPSQVLKPVAGPVDEAPAEEKEAAEEYARMIEGWEVILEGQDVANAQPLIDASGTKPQFFFSAEGSKKMEAFSRRYANQQENIAFVLDGKVLNIAPIERNTILSDQAYINGSFDPAYVKQLTELIKAGSLPVDLIQLSGQNVDPTIGSAAFEQMLIAAAISIGITFAFLLAYYSFPGLVATIAMLLYALFTVTLMKLINATFSLAAIAALILSVSMAVDANILVFERIKEEIRSGKELMKAISLGFSRALSAIIDSNATTIATSLVLFWLNSGAVRGFATALILGVAVSFFTAISVTRLLLVAFTKAGVAADPKFYALNRNWFGERLEQKADTRPINVVGSYKRYFIISAAIMVAGLIFIFPPFNGIKPNVEFSGGYELESAAPASVTGDSIRSGLSAKGVPGVNIKFATVDGQRIVYVTAPLDPDIPQNSEEAKNFLAEAAGLNPEEARISNVGPTVAAETVRNAFLGVIISSAIIILYLSFRFGVSLGGFAKGVKFGFSAITALLHDVAVVVGTAAIVGFLLGWEISSLFITAMLTVVGFSVHDTIVIFDRIRENLKKAAKGETFENLVNRSITQSVARSINTSFTAVLTLIVLLIVGTPTPELKFMVLTMLVGILIGTYSSIFNASPVLWLWNQAVIRQKGEEAGMMALAIQENQARIRAAAQQRVEESTAAAGYGTVKRRTGGQSSTRIKEDDE
jgi:SecD/SecF fusion protein